MRNAAQQAHVACPGFDTLCGGGGRDVAGMSGAMAVADSRQIWLLCPDPANNVRIYAQTVRIQAQTVRFQAQTVRIPSLPDIFKQTTINLK